MTKVVTDNVHYYAIANAIRALTESNETYTPAEMATAIYEYIAGDIDLSNIEPYFITEVVNAMKYVKNLGTTDWVHHLVVTDTHFLRNWGHSTPIIKAMQDTGYFSKVMHLGDITDDAAQANIEASVANYGQFNGDLLFCIGNHDVMFTGYETYWYENLLDEDTDIVTTDIANFNYYWDDAEHNIRYIVYGYSGTSGGANYAIDRMKDAPSGYAIITLCHYKDLITSKAIIPLIGKELEYIGNIDGHTHSDEYSSEYGGMFNQVVLLNDSKSNDTGNPSYNKVEGTDTEQAFTIMSINTTTRNVKFYRIGRTAQLGQNWQYTYLKGGSVETWIKGAYWGTGTLTNATDAYYSTKKYPRYDSGDNGLNYYIYSTSGVATYVYMLGMNASGNWEGTQRLSKDTSYKFRNIMLVGSSMWSTNVSDYLVSINSDGNITSVNDIVVTNTMPSMGAYSSTLWESGYYLTSGGLENTDSTSASTIAFDVLPDTQYHFYVDDSGWGGSEYMYAITYTGTSFNKNMVGGFAVSRRLGSGTAGTKEITFTTNSSEHYARMTIQGITSVTDFASKCHLEVVTS